LVTGAAGRVGGVGRTVTKLLLEQGPQCLRMPLRRNSQPPRR